MCAIHTCCVFLDVCWFCCSFVCLNLNAYDFKCKVHCRSALGLGASGLLSYCTPLVSVPDVIGGLAVWWHNKQKIKSQIRHLGSFTAANWVSFDFNVSYFSCWGYSLINTLKLKKKSTPSTLRAHPLSFSLLSSLKLLYVYIYVYTYKYIYI